MLNEVDNPSNPPSIEVNTTKEMECDAMMPKEDPWAGIAIPQGYELTKEGAFRNAIGFQIFLFSMVQE